MKKSKTFLLVVIITSKILETPLSWFKAVGIDLKNNNNNKNKNQSYKIQTISSQSLLNLLCGKRPVDAVDQVNYSFNREYSLGWQQSKQ